MEMIWRKRKRKNSQTLSALMEGFHDAPWLSVSPALGGYMPASSRRVVMRWAWASVHQRYTSPTGCGTLAACEGPGWIPAQLDKLLGRQVGTAWSSPTEPDNARHMWAHAVPARDAECCLCLFVTLDINKLLITEHHFTQQTHWQLWIAGRGYEPIIEVFYRILATFFLGLSHFADPALLFFKINK